MAKGKNVRTRCNECEEKQTWVNSVVAGSGLTTVNTSITDASKPGHEAKALPEAEP